MKNLFKKEDARSNLQKVYDEIVEDLQTERVGTDRYKELSDLAERYHAMLMEEESHKKSVSPDAIIGLVTSLGGIAMICGFERIGNITSKALNFVFKGRVR